MNYLSIKTLNDNYSWIIYNSNKQAIVIDCGELAPVKQAIAQHQLKVEYILITHHHPDHVNAIDDLQKLTGAKVVGCGNFKNILPKLDLEFTFNETAECELNIFNTTIRAFHTPGHCEDHVVYYFTKQGWLFSGDLIFNLGAGKIFNGSTPQLLNSVELVKKLPQHTIICFGHDYFDNNLMFSKSLNYFNFDNLNLQNHYKDCSTLAVQLAYNPFFNCNVPPFARHILQEQALSADFAVKTHDVLRYKKARFLIGS